MKLWIGYGTEHSANLVIIGHFKTANDAIEAKELIDKLTNIVQEGVTSGRLSESDGLENGKFSGEQLNFFTANNIGSYAYSDMISFLYEYNSFVDGTKLIITTNDLMTSGFVNTMIAKSAKLEIYSAHDYKDTGYGR